MMQRKIAWIVVDALAVAFGVALSVPFFLVVLAPFIAG